MKRRTRSWAGPLVGAVVVVGLAMGSGCSENCCTIDSLPIPLERTPIGSGSSERPGGLQARARGPTINGNQPFAMSIDTGSPLTVSVGSADGASETVSRSFDILGAAPDVAVRASFHDITMLSVPLGAVGDSTSRPGGVLGGDLLRGFSVEFRFGVPSSMTFWPNQRADDGFLGEVGYAVIHFAPFGGGEISATGGPDLFGLRGPASVAPTRIVFRACAGPEPFDPSTSPRQACCKRGDEITDATGTPLALLLATGVGPLVLSQAAWNRMLPVLLPVVPDVVPNGKLYLAAVTDPLDVSWSVLPSTAHLALVNQEASAAADPGPCVELARSRRIEWVAHRQQGGPETADCVQPCDTDPNDTSKAQNSAAYVELGGEVGNEIPVAILKDGDPYLEGLRADIRPEGPEIDGIIGAGVLGRTRVEIDYRSSGMRAIFSCDGSTDRNVCWAAPRCPRLPDRTQTHTCFGLPEGRLPVTCIDDMCGN
jgi:hypothetical protein